MAINTDLRYLKPSEEIIRDLIWFTSGMRIPPGYVEFGIPEAFEPSPMDSIGRNTKVTSKGTIKQSKYFKGEQLFFYRRLSLEELEPLTGDKITIEKFPFSTYDVLDQINVLFGLMLSHDDVEDITYDSFDEPYKLVAKSSSLVWSGERELDIVVQNLLLFRNESLSGFTEFSISLPDLLNKNSLTGFRKYGDTTGPSTIKEKLIDYVSLGSVFGFSRLK